MHVSCLLVLSSFHHILAFVVSFFFFQCSGDHRDLHSFPTRRSSDLALARPCHQPRHAAKLVVDAQTRSEEHTSELQSRVDLVCRLLLEKKKKTKAAFYRELHHLQSAYQGALRANGIAKILHVPI